MRLFISVDFDKETKEKMSKLQSDLKKMSTKGRWKYVDNFHLTLKFLGEVDANKVKQLSESIEIATLGINKFKIKVNELGKFDGKESIRVIWLGVNGQLDVLNSLYNNIEEQLSKIGFLKENRKYSPHVTMGQDVVLKQDFNAVRNIVNNYNFKEMIVEKIILMQSEEIHGKRVYTPLEEYILYKGRNLQQPEIEI